MKKLNRNLYGMALCIAAVLPAGAQNLTINRIVDDNTHRPDGLGRFSLANANIPAFDGHTIVFPNGNFDSIWVADQGGLNYTKLVSTATPVPGGTGNFSALQASGVPLARGGIVVFSALDSSSPANPGLYTVLTSGGPVSLVANQNTPSPSGGGGFTAFNGDGQSTYGDFLSIAARWRFGPRIALTSECTLPTPTVVDWPWSRTTTRLARQPI